MERRVPFHSLPPPCSGQAGVSKRGAAASGAGSTGEVSPDAEKDSSSAAGGTNGVSTSEVAEGRESAASGEGEGGSSTTKTQASGAEGGRTEEDAGGEAEKKRREDFGRLTDLADGLLQAGQHDIYQQTRDDLEEGAAAAAAAEAARAATTGGGGALSSGCPGYGTRGPIPRRRIDNQIDPVGSGRLFCTSDLMSVFFRLTIHLGSVYMTGFIVP